MKRKLIALCVSSVLVGSGIIFNMNQDVSVPTVEKFTEDTSASVSKHDTKVSKRENVDKMKKALLHQQTEKQKLKNRKMKKVLLKKMNLKKLQVSKHLQVKVRLQPVLLRKLKNKIPKKKVLVRVLPVQIKNLQLQTVPMHRVNQTIILSINLLKSLMNPNKNLR